MRRSTPVLAGLALAAVVVPFAGVVDLPGADDQSQVVASSNAPGFTPHARPLFEPSSGVEGRLFALQAGLGTAGVAGAVLALRRRGRRACSP